MVLSVMLIVAGQVTAVAEVFLVRDTFQSSALTFGLLVATWVLGSVFGTMFAVRFNTPARILVGVPVAAAVMASGVAVTGLSRSLTTAFVMFVIAGAANSVVSVGTGTLVQLRADRAALGRVLSSFTGVLQSASLISAALGGLLIALFAPDTVFTLSGAFSLLAVVATVPAFRRALAKTSDTSAPAPSPM
jgi:predicted MFS family arabinose efflux permease